MSGKQLLEGAGGQAAARGPAQAHAQPRLAPAQQRAKVAAQQRARVAAQRVLQAVQVRLQDVRDSYKTTRLSGVDMDTAAKSNTLRRFGCCSAANACGCQARKSDVVTQDLERVHNVADHAGQSTLLLGALRRGCNNVIHPLRSEANTA